MSLNSRQKVRRFLVITTTHTWRLMLLYTHKMFHNVKHSSEHKCPGWAQLKLFGCCFSARHTHNSCNPIMLTIMIHWHTTCQVRILGSLPPPGRNMVGKIHRTENITVKTRHALVLGKFSTHKSYDTWPDNAGIIYLLWFGPSFRRQPVPFSRFSRVETRTQHVLFQRKAFVQINARATLGGIPRGPARVKL